VHGAGCGTLYVYLSLPETKGISLAAIQVLLQEEGLRVEKPDARSHVHTVYESLAKFLLCAFPVIDVERPQVNTVQAWHGFCGSPALK